MALAAALIAACATAPDAPERGVLFDDFTDASRAVPAREAGRG